MKYDAKQVVITGTSRGLGAMLKAYFEAEGATVTGLSRSEGCDISNILAVREHMPKHVDIAINNASVMYAGYSLMAGASDTLEMLHTNFLGTFFCTREAAKRGASRIVNLGSIAVPLEDAGTAIYAASKAAVLTMSGVLAKEFSPRTTVNTIGVSALDTPMFAQHSEATQRAILAKLTPPRLATITDITHVIDFLVSDLASNVTGQVIYLGGVR